MGIMALWLPQGDSDHIPLAAPYVHKRFTLSYQETIFTFRENKITHEITWSGPDESDILVTFLQQSEIHLRCTIVEFFAWHWTKRGSLGKFS